MPTEEQREKAGELMTFANVNLDHMGMQMELAYSEIERLRQQRQHLISQINAVRDEYLRYKQGKEDEENKSEKHIDMAD